MARRRKDEQEGYNEQPSEHDQEELGQAHAPEPDSRPDAVGEAEPDPESSADYSVEQEGFTMRGEVFAKGEVVNMQRKVAARQIARGIALVEVK